MHGILTPVELLAIDTCPDCGAHATKHNDLGRTITPTVCARTVPGARLAAVEKIVLDRAADVTLTEGEVEELIAHTADRDDLVAALRASFARPLPPATEGGDDLG